MKFDLHIHSKYSDDALTRPETAMKLASKKGIGLAITDHDNTRAWPEFKKFAKGFKVPLIYGEELSTEDSKGKQSGDIIGLFLNEGIKSRFYPEVLDEIKAQGAVSVAAHPFDSLRNRCRPIEEIKPRLDLIEVINSRCYFSSFNKKAEEFAVRNKLGFSAGSDAHTPEEIGLAWVECDAGTSEELRRALLKGKASYGGKLSGLVPHIKTRLRAWGLLKEV